jgi:serine/threonine-protein kinase
VRLKVLSPEVAADAARMDRLKEALELARMIAHPNVMTVLDFGKVDGLVYVSTAFVQGAPLEFFLAEGRPMPLAPAFLLARQIADGLLAAHRQKLVHGALKPENVLVEPGGRVRVMDFAMGAPLTSANRGAPHAGAAYLAP